MAADDDIYDIIIVGAGPCGLATAARLREHTPAALFTDEEHRRFHWINKYGDNVSLKHVRSGKLSAPRRKIKPEYRMMVLDGTDDKWLGRWKELFGLYDISHLRSPMLWHVDPLDRDSLLAHAYSERREDELVEIRKDLDYGPVEGLSIDDEPVFTVKTHGKQFYAKAVILAVGAANDAEIPRMPSMPADLQDVRQACHSLRIKVFPDPIVQQRMAAGVATNLLIVGGGLTSAQLTDLAIRKGVTKVWHIMRGPCRVKHFDVDLEWMGKYKNTEQARFWLADSDEERLEIIKSARGGGSFTPLFYKRLKRHVASGRLELHEKITLLDTIFEEADEGKGVWRVKTDPPLDMPSFDYIYFATGIQTNVSNLPYLKTIREKYPIDSFGGLPCINEDLMWAEQLPLYCVGRLSALQLGPAAPNIGGAKLGAERVAWAIEDTIKPSGWTRDEDAPRHDGGGMAGYLSGHGNMYGALAIEAS